MNEGVMVAGPAQLVPNQHIRRAQHAVEKRVIKRVAPPVGEKVDTGLRLLHAVELIK